MTPGQPGPDEPGTQPADETREMPRPSPWSREGGGQPYGNEPPEPRYAGPDYGSGQQWGQQGAQQWGAPQPSPYDQQPSPYGQTQQAPYTAPWASPGAPSPYAPGWGGPAAPPPGPGKRRRAGIIAGAVLLVLAAAGGVTAAILVGSDDSGTPSAAPSAPVTTPAPDPSGSSAPSASPSPSASPTPSPSLQLVPTPPGLLAIGYRAYALRELTADAVAIDNAELAQFRRYGLSRVVNLRALTLGKSGTRTDDWDAGVTVLRFRDAAGAKAELDYSNTQNEKDGMTIALPGLPDATGFVNTDEDGGVSVSAFATTGRYQVVVSVRGLTGNTTNARGVAAEAARVLRAVLPSASAIANADVPSGGIEPNFPTPTPSGTSA